MTEPLRWPRLVDACRRVAKSRLKTPPPAWWVGPWRDGAYGGPLTVYPSAISHAPASLHQLLRHEQILAEAMADDRLADAFAEWTEIEHWLEEELAPEGWWLAAPRETYLAFWVVDRIRRALGPTLFAEAHAERWTRLTDCVWHSLSIWWLPEKKPTPIAEAIACRLADSLESASGKPWFNPAVWNRVVVAKPKPRLEPPTASIQSDAARWAILRRDWSIVSPRLSIAHGTNIPHIEFHVGSSLVWDQPWDVSFMSSTEERSLLVDHPDTPWDCVCWQDDVDGTYIELTWEQGSVKIDRHFYLAREWPILWLMDTVTIAQPSDGRLTWSMDFPSATRLQQPVRQQRQWRVEGLGVDLHVIPLSLPPLASQSTTGWLKPNQKPTADGGESLHYAGETTGKTRLSLAMAAVWDKKRLLDQVDWRQLTVTAQRKTLGLADAVAHRLKIGSTQVVFFRRLARPCRHAFLGHQTPHETIVGEFTSTGVIRELVAVEGGLADVD